MNILERYKKLSEEDKKNLNEYCIFHSIYSIAERVGYKMSDDEVERIKDLSYYIYLKDQYYNFEPLRISDYITVGYLQYKIPLEIYKNMSYHEILEAIDNDSYKSNESIERL